jgi:hypothetical protein
MNKKMAPILLCVIAIAVIVAVIYILRRYGIIEPFGTHPPHELSSFVNFNLTEKPVANYAPYDIFQLWESGQLYGKNQDTYHKCDQYRCQSTKFNQLNAQPHDTMDMGERPLKVIDKCAAPHCAYYGDSAQYCANHPGDTRCPDYWKYTKNETLSE